MKINVIFSPYCSFAIIGFSEMKLFGVGQQISSGCSPGHVSARRVARGVVREHLPPQSEGERDDEEHEQPHLCHEEQED